MSLVCFHLSVEADPNGVLSPKEEHDACGHLLDPITLLRVRWAPDREEAWLVGEDS